jgi:shikimate kinase
MSVEGPRPNVALIGMPGAGKSTLGVLLAKRTARLFLDTDLRIQDEQGTSLRQLIEERGVDAFRRIEERCLQTLDCRGSVIATGGSVVYSVPAMERLASIAVCVYLDVPAGELASRVGSLSARGVVRAPGQGLEELLAERRPLYERWADVHLPCAGLGHEAAVEAIVAALASHAARGQA